MGDSVDARRRRLYFGHNVAAQVGEAQGVLHFAAHGNFVLVGENVYKVHRSRVLGVGRGGRSHGVHRGERPEVIEGGPGASSATEELSFQTDRSDPPPYLSHQVVVFVGKDLCREEEKKDQCGSIFSRRETAFVGQP